MKKNLFLIVMLFLAGNMMAQAANQPQTIRISTDETDLIYQAAPNGRLYQTYLGEKLRHEADLECLSPYGKGGSDGSAGQKGWDIYLPAGSGDYFEPALGITHSDGNRSTVLTFVSSEEKALDGNATETLIRLEDKQYPLQVVLHYVAYKKENIIKTWTEIQHQEKKPVYLTEYASSILYFENPSYYLTEYSGDWAKEMQMSTQPLRPGKKILETKLGTRAAMYMYPFFELGIGQPAEEHQGEVILGTIGWTGNYRFTFEVDNVHNLRVISGINPYASRYELKPGETFTTPEFIFTRSDEGTGKASRNFHAWARNYQLKDGKGDRMTLLNNWENTGFKFDETKLSALMQEAKHLGVDMFLLDDGWFGNKYPRNNDRAGLGDWQVMENKLPHGIPFLVKEAEKAGVKFGIWIEPEMVNPKSELAEQHPDWIIRLPNRETYYYRNQLVLDLSNPEVQEFVYGVVDGLLSENPGIAFFKWDCNSPITNVYSPYLKEKQEQLYVDYVRGLYKVLDRIQAKYPDLPMMLCSGGGARCDYEALKYFTEFWASDNTDPVERLYIQWGFSQFFPSKAMCAHVTSWNRQTSVKFRVDVAMMCKLGFDIGLEGLSDEERTFCQQAVQTYHRLKPVILDGDLYRLASPYEGEHMAVMHVDATQTKSVLYTYNIHPRYAETLYPIRLQGLDPDKQYKVEEINLMPGAKSSFSRNGQTYSGDYLMKVGLRLFSTQATSSHLFELTAL